MLSQAQKNALLRAIQDGQIDPGLLSSPEYDGLSDYGDQPSRTMDRIGNAQPDYGDQPSRAAENQRNALAATIAAANGGDYGDQPSRAMDRGPASPPAALKDLPTDELRQRYHPAQGGFVRNESTGQTLFLNGQPGGISEQPYGTPMADFQQQFGQPRTMRVIGTGNGVTADLGTEQAQPVQLDRSRSPVDIPGVGKAIYGKDGNAYVLGPDGQPTTKAILGFDLGGTMALNKYADERRKAQADVEHTQAATAELGAPRYQLTPEGDVFNTRSGQITAQGAQSGQTQRNMQKAAYTQGLKELEQDDKEAANYSSVEQALKRFEELNQKVMSGRISGFGPVNWMLSLSNPERQEMEKIQSFLAMNNFKPGQGSMSNFERSLITKGGPNLSNDPEANNDIVAAQRGLIQDARDRGAFRQAYLQSHGNLVGAEQQWQQYRSANPVVVQDEKGRVIANPQRQTWMDYFSGAGSNQPAQPMETQRPGTAPASAQQALPMPSSKSALIPNQYYRTARGVARWTGTQFE